jgi:hypothetical protein
MLSNKKKKKELARAKQLEDTQLLPQRGKSCSVSGFAHTKWGLSLFLRGTVPILYTVPAQPSNGLLAAQPSPDEEELFLKRKLPSCLY